jgi:Brp/Blh family beta-carotene 15,15'-monooxygenase
MTSSPAWQTWLFICAAAFAVVLTGLLEPDLTTQVFLLAPFVAVIGLPHGALDLSIAKVLWPLRGWHGKVKFVSLYLSLSALIVIFWILFPSASLFAFLIYSAVHFSGDWSDSPTALRWCGGAATIGGPALFHQGDVAHIFGYLAPESAANLATSCLVIAGGTALVIFVAMLILQPTTRTRAAAEQAAIWLAAGLLVPLVYFIVYFCVLHSVRHTVATIESLKDRKDALLTAGFLSAIKALMAVTSILFLDSFKASLIVESISQTVFIGLAALTIPHMILVNRFQRRSHHLAEAL